MDLDESSAPARRALGFEWAIVAIGTGIALYFSLPFEPNLAAFTAIIAASALATYLTRGRTALGLINFALFLILLGGYRAAIHAHAEHTPRLSTTDNYYKVTGWIEAVERSGTGFRWVIRVSDIETRGKSLEPQERPHRVRIRTKPAGFIPEMG